MSAPSGVGDEAGVPSTSGSGADAGAGSGGGEVREEMVENAVQFLKHPKVVGAGVEEKRVFMRGKGLSEAEIAEAERRAAVSGGGGTVGSQAVGSAAAAGGGGGQPPVPVYQQAAGAQRMGPSPGQQQGMAMGMAMAPGGPPPRRTRPRVTSMLLVASVLTGATYGVGWVLRRLVFPALVPVLRGVSWLRWLADLMARLSLPPQGGGGAGLSPAVTPRRDEEGARSDLAALARSVEKQFGALEARLEAMAGGVTKLENKLGEHSGQVEEAIRESAGARREVKQQVEEALRNVLPESPFAPEARAMREVREDMAAVKRVLKIDGAHDPPSPAPYWGGAEAGREWGDAIDQKLDGLSSGSSLLAQAQEAANNIISDRARKGKAPASESEEPLHMSSPQAASADHGAQGSPRAPLTPYSQSYAEVMEMLQKGITPPNVNNTLDDTPPDPEAQVKPGDSPPVPKPWSSPTGGDSFAYSKNPYLAVAKQPELGLSAQQPAGGSNN